MNQTVLVENHGVLTAYEVLRNIAKKVKARPEFERGFESKPKPNWFRLVYNDKYQFIELLDMAKGKGLQARIIGEIAKAGLAFNVDTVRRNEAQARPHTENIRITNIHYVSAA